MRPDKRKTASLKRLEVFPLPPSLLAAFEAVENLDAMRHAPRGQAFGEMIRPAGHDSRAGPRFDSPRVLP